MNGQDMYTIGKVYGWTNLVLCIIFTGSLVVLIIWFLLRRKSSDWPLHLKV